MSIYQEIILDHYRNPRNNGKLKNPTSTISVSNPLCGDIIQMDIEELGGKVVAVAYSGQGCAISQAAASLLTEQVKGKSKDEIMGLDKEYVFELLGIQLSPNRIKCALLSLEALHKVLNTRP